MESSTTEGGTERLAAWIEECRTAGAVADPQDLHQRLLKELVALQERWNTVVVVSRGSSTGSLFQVLLQVLLVYSGNHAGGAASGVGASMAIPLISSSVATSECVLILLCELLAKAYDYAAAPVVNDHLSGKHASTYIKTALVMVVARLPSYEASQFIPEAVAFANRNVKAADFYIKQCLIESVARILQNTNSPRLASCHGDALKIVTKVFQDKMPEVRLAAAGLLHVVATKTTAISSSSSSASHGAGALAGGGMNGSAGGSAASGGISSGGGGTGSSGGPPGSGGAASAGAATLDAIMHTATKGMDDATPEARRAFSVVVGIVLAKYAAFGSYDLTHGGDLHSTPTTADDTSSPNPSGHDGEGGSSTTTNGGGSGNGSNTKSKSLGFKLPGMHMPGMGTLTLSRRKTGTSMADFSSIANVVLYLKDLVVTKYLSSSPSHGHHHGGILASYAVALCSLFERLPQDLLADNQLDDIVLAILSILDHQLTLPDLTRARNAVCFALRYGVNLALTERQQTALLGVYVQISGSIMENESFNHHKVLAVLVESSHLIQSLGEASVVHANDALPVLHSLLTHEKQSLRFQAAVAMASLLTALPYKLKHCLLDCLASLRETTALLLKDTFDRNAAHHQSADSGDDDDHTPSSKSKTHLYAVQGYSTAIAHIVRAFVLQPTSGSSTSTGGGSSGSTTAAGSSGGVSGGGGLSHSMLSSIMNLAERLIESQFIDGCSDSIWLTCTRAGWNLVGSLVTVQDDHWIHLWLRKLADMWLRSSILHTREASLELLRIEAAVVALHSFVFSRRDIVAKSQTLQTLAAHVLHAYLVASQSRLAKPQKRRGQIARYRLLAWIMKCFTVLPQVFNDSYILLLDVITEFATAQSLTSVTHSPLSPAASTFLCNALSGADDPLEMVTTSRIEPGDLPSGLYSRELNHILALLQHENALSDIEIEVQYLDTFCGLYCEFVSVGNGNGNGANNELYDRVMCSSFTYTRLVDASVFLFGYIFHSLPEDLQLRCLQHFSSVQSDSTSFASASTTGNTGASSTTARAAAVDVNVCALLFAVVKQAKTTASGSVSVSVSSSGSSGSSWVSHVQSAMLDMVASDHAMIRRGACEALGLLTSIIPDPSARNQLVYELEQRLIAAEKLPANTTLTTSSISGTSGSTAAVDSSVLAAGASFALACIKRACGSRITIDSGLIFRFAGEITQPLRTWILHSWSIVVDSVSVSGGDYDQYVKSSTSLIEAHLVAGFVYSNKTNKKFIRWQISSRVSIARIINGIVATLGPEMATCQPLLTELYTLYGLLRQDGYLDPRLELEYLKFIEQVVVFVPTRFEMDDLVYILSIVSDVSIGSSPSIQDPSNSSEAMALAASSSPPIQTATDQSEATFSTESSSSLSKHHNVLVCVNGLARNILQQIGMSCLRTLAERDPEMIRKFNLPCLLFHALHVETTSTTWRYLPALHGMWDFQTFKFFVPCKSRNGWQEIQNTLLALIDIDGGNWGSCQPCVWALLCRGIAIGESSSAISSSQQADDETLMMSPKGVELMALPGLVSTASTTSSTNDDTRNNNEDKRNTGTHASTMAAAAQVEMWRRTKKYVRSLLALLPLLSRQVRRFAVECVLRIFELVSRGAESDVAPHFDLIEARARFLATVTATGTGTSSNLNFLSMYVDEFVTLACHATMASADGNELCIFQTDGLRLLKVVLAKFYLAKDPEVNQENDQENDSSFFLLNPYQAQISSAIRHAVKQVQLPFDGLDDGHDLYAPLAIEAWTLCGDSIKYRLVNDKIALGRLVRMAVAKDYGHSHHFVGDEATRVALALANLACLANLVISSLTDGNGSSLAKALMSNLGVGAMENLVGCWLDATSCYGLLMQGVGHWPVASLLAVSHDHTIVTSSVLKLVMPVTPPHFAASQSQQQPPASPTVEILRESFKKYWPALPLAVAALLKANALTNSQIVAPLAKLEELLAYSIFHLVSSVRDRNESEFVPVLQAIPRLLQAISTSSSSSVSSSSQQSEFATSSIAALMFASSHAYAAVRLACLASLFECLASLPVQGASFSSDLLSLCAHAALCPLQILTQIADPSKHRLSISGRDDTSYVPQILRFAANGVVFLRTHESSRVRGSILEALPLIDRCSVFFLHHPEQSSAFTSVHRLVVESAVAYLADHDQDVGGGDDDDDEESEYYVDPIARSLSLTLALMDSAVLTSGDDHQEPPTPVEQHQAEEEAARFVFRLAGNFALRVPSTLAHVFAAFHGAMALRTKQLLTSSAVGGTDAAVVVAAAIAGVRTVVQKLIDSHDLANAQRYFGLLGPILIELFDVATTSSSAIAGDELDEVEQWLRILSTQLDETHGAAFVRLMLPKISMVLLNHHDQDKNKHKTAPILARLLLSFAQTRGVTFKEVVVSMAPTARSVLETTLRSALTASAGPSSSVVGAAGTPSGGNNQGLGMSKPLDLSRYK